MDSTDVVTVKILFRKSTYSTRPFIGNNFDKETGRDFPVIPCERHEHCRSLLNLIREGINKNACVGGGQYTEIDVALERRVNCYIAHLPADNKPELKFTDLWRDETEITLPDAKPGRQLINLGKSGAGEASCHLVIYNGHGLMVDCGASVGKLGTDSGGEKKPELVETDNPMDIWDDKDTLAAHIDQEEAETKPAESIEEALPNFDRLFEMINAGLILDAIVNTHGHLDHIMGTGYLAKKYQARGQTLPPIYGSAFAMSYVHRLLKELFENDPEETRLTFFPTNVIKPGQILDIGPFRVKPFKVRHSVPGSYGYAISVADDPSAAQVVIMGDFKTRLKDARDLIETCKIFGEIGAAKLLLADTTYGYRQGKTELITENETALLDIMMKAKKKQRRVILSFIASNFDCFQQAYGLADRLAMAVSYFGPSLDKMIQSSGVTMPRVDYSDPTAQVFIVTGCQADASSVLNRLSWKESVGGLRIRPDDIVVHLSRPIPGRGWAVVNMLKRCQGLGAEVIIDTDFPGPDTMFGFERQKLHTSGHGSQEDIAVALEQFRPDYFLPVHAHPRAMEAAAEMAWQKFNIPQERTLLLSHPNYTINW